MGLLLIGGSFLPDPAQYKEFQGLYQIVFFEIFEVRVYLIKVVGEYIHFSLNWLRIDKVINLPKSRKKVLTDLLGIYFSTVRQNRLYKLSFGTWVLFTGNTRFKEILFERGVLFCE